MSRLRLLARVSALAFAAAASAPASCQGLSAEQAQEALKAAIQARTAAEDALKRADAAILAAQAIIQGDRDRVPSPSPSTETVRTEYKPSKCDRPAPNGTVDQTLNLAPKSGILDENGPNWFARKCLGIDHPAKLKSSADVSLQLTGATKSGLIELSPSYTWRSFSRLGNGDEFRSSYTRLKITGFGTVGDDASAAVYDLTKFEFSKGIGFEIGLEWGRSARLKESKVRSDLAEQIAKARRECVAYHGVSDPFIDADVGARPLVNQNAPARCEGEALEAWMSDDKRRSDYWTAMVRPLWGYDVEPGLFGGVSLRYGFDKPEFFPFSDPAMLGTTLLASLPADFPNGATSLDLEPYAIRGHLGASGKGWKGISWATIGSLTYRREFSFPDKTKDQQVCSPPAPGQSFTRCFKVNIASPYEAEGFVAAIALNISTPRVALLPPIAFSIRPSYAFDTKRWGVEVPMYIAADAEGKLTSGVRLTCRGNGETEQGYPLAKSCAAALFVGTKFGLTSP